MSAYDDRLARLQERAARRLRLEAMLTELKRQRAELEERAAQLEQVKLDEQADVDRLEGGGLAAMFYSLLGKGGEKLTKERREAAAAALKYEAAARELSAVCGDLERYEAEYAGLEGAEAQYEAALAEKREALKRSGGGTARRILELEAGLAACQSRKKEILEAIAAGSDALAAAEMVLDSLDSAESWATWDLFGGGLISDLAKHEHLDMAQRNVELLQAQLGTFRTELADVGDLRADIQVSVEGFTRFADFWLDCIFVDAAVLEHIGDSIQQLSVTRDGISRGLARLHELLQSTEAEAAEKKKLTDELVSGA